jgi:hypothetical protein
MHRARSLAARGRAAVLVLGAALALVGCADDPDVAAYVGDERLAESEVDRLIADATAKAAGRQGVGAPSRSDVVITHVLGRLCADRQAKDGFPGREVTVAQISEIDSVPADSGYAQLRASTYTCLSGMPVANAVLPTDADLQDIYDRAVSKGLLDVPLSEIRDQLAADPSVQQAIAVKRMLTDLVDAGDVRVNPRYRPMEFRVSDLQTGQALIVAVVGEPGSDAVRDVA